MSATEPLRDRPVNDLETQECPRASVRPLRLRWWVELVYASVFYAGYSAVRDLQGSASVSTRHAYDDAARIISAEEHLHIFVEHGVQRLALHFTPAIDLSNVF